MMRRTMIVTTAALVAALLLPGSGGLAAAGETTFYGSGYGHGIGMSQWGAYGLAQMGWGYRQILTHFYTGTKVEASDSLPKSIRVGLTSGRSAIHLTAKGGPIRIWEGSPKDGVLVGRIRTEETWVVQAKQRNYAVETADGSLAGGKRWGGKATHLYVTYADTGSRVFIPEADGIWNDGFVYDRGSIEFNLHSCGDTDGCQERIIARLTLEEYLLGLGEVPSSWPAEALAAQVVAARSFAAYAIRRYGVRSECNCHLTDGAGDQVYMGYDKIAGAYGHRWAAAVSRTQGRVVTHQGSVIQAFYAASDGGHSEDVENVWHGGNDAYAIPWLRGVCDPGESTSVNPWTDWSRSFGASTLTSRLAPYTGAIGTITGFTKVRRSASGRILSLVAQGTGGSDPLTGGQLQAGLGLPDERVWIDQDRNVVGPIREAYDGLMCAPGLPTSSRRAVTGGAQQFFRNGALYRNSGLAKTFWLKGAIDAEYRAVGAGAGVLGLPVSQAKPLSQLKTAGGCAGCSRVDFATGRIYRKSGLGASALWGDVLDSFLAEGGAGGSLGFPETRVRNLSGGGTRARFEHGRITCPVDAPCRVIYA